MIIETIIQVISKGYKYTVTSSSLSESKVLGENYHWFMLQSRMSLTLQSYMHWKY